jgi:hypothetical protein
MQTFAFRDEFPDQWQRNRHRSSHHVVLNKGLVVWQNPKGWREMQAVTRLDNLTAERTSANRPTRAAASRERQPTRIPATNSTQDKVMPTTQQAKTNTESFCNRWTFVSTILGIGRSECAVISLFIEATGFVSWPGSGLLQDTTVSLYPSQKPQRP